MENKLLEIWEEAVGMSWEDWSKRSWMERDSVGYDRFDIMTSQVRNSGMTRAQLLNATPMSSYRDERRHIYSWAVPSPEAIRLIVKYSPIVEIGAGTGYWAALLRDKGAIVHAYDKNPPKGGEENYWAKGATMWTEVMIGGPENVFLHRDATLFLCWPPMDQMAYFALKFYKGKRVIYIGESLGGATADDAFFELLDEEWIEKKSLIIPQWLGMHDYLAMYVRA